MAEEYLEVCSAADGTPTGVKKLRKEVHRDGDWHRVVHVWLVNPHGELLIQKRSMKKEAYPGLWDISCAGHVSWGESALDAAEKELSEELGVGFAPDELKAAHLLSHRNSSVLNGGTYINNEIVELFLVPIPDWPLAKYRLQADEVDEVRYIHWRELERALRAKDPAFVGCNVEDAYYGTFFAKLAHYHPHPQPHPHHHHHPHHQQQQK